MRVLSATRRDIVDTGFGIRVVIRIVLLAAAFLVIRPGMAGAHPAASERLGELGRHLDETPCDVSLLVKRAEVYGVLGRWEAAEAELDRAEKCRPEADGLDLVRARLALEMGRPGTADELLGHFLASQPENATAHLLRGRALRQVGRPGEAAREFARGLELSAAPGPDDYLLYARALVEAGSADRALQALDSGIARLGDVASLHRAGIEIELDRGNPAAAVLRVDRLLARGGANEAWLLRRAEILEGAGRQAEARVTLEQAAGELAARPERRRNTRAVREIESAVRAGLERLKGSGAVLQPAGESPMCRSEAP